MPVTNNLKKTALEVLYMYTVEAN